MKMKIAFIGGCGHLMMRQLLDLEPELVEAIAVAGDGLEDEKARVQLSRFPGAQWFDDPREMLEKFRPDLVNVGPVFGKICEWTIAVLEDGIPVVSEKPLVNTRKQLEQLREVVARKGGHLFTEFPCRCRGTFRAARECIQRGEIGEVVMITGQKSYRFGEKRPHWYGDRDLYPGTAMWVASHYIDAAWFCTGRKFDSAIGIQGNLSKPSYGSMEDHTITMFRLDNGGSCVIHSDFLRPNSAPTHSDERLRIAGSKGVIVLEGSDRASLITEEGGATELVSEGMGTEFYREVLSAIAGNESVLSTANSLYIAEVLLAAREGGDTGKWVSCS